nr:DUF1016 N-terminal domain-containing protein [Variovorax boronicumulans]
MTLKPPPKALLARIRQIWDSARTQAARSVNTAHVCANWLIGQQIVEAEQGGARRAEYGQALLASLSERLSQDYGEGFSVSALKYMRLFYLGYPELLTIVTHYVTHRARQGQSVTQCVTYLPKGRHGAPVRCTPACRGRTTVPC